MKKIIELGLADRLAAAARLRAPPRIHASIGLHGHFTLTVSGGKRGTVVLADFDNMILDAGLNYVAGGGTSASGYCQVGTGTTPVAAGQTTLANYLANTASVSRDWGSGVYVAGPPAYKWDYKTYRFTTGVAAGNLTEVGIGWTSSGNLFSRALILDGGGSPTTITVLSDETLDVTYTLRVYAPSDVTGTIPLAGIDYGFTLRAAAMASGGTGTWNAADLMRAGMANAAAANAPVYSGAISATPGGVPSGSSVGGSAVCTVSAYVANSLQRNVEYRLDLNQANLGGGFKSMYVLVSGNLGGGGSSPTHGYQIEFSPNVPKDNTKVLRLNFTFSLARAP
ncbi:MAG TPA: hypothetical protein VGE36_13815 [Roseateles sp.]